MMGLGSSRRGSLREAAGASWTALVCVRMITMGREMTVAPSAELGI